MACIYRLTVILLLACIAAVANAAQLDPAELAHGAYVAREADCVACHTAPGGPAFGGGYAIDTPFGKIYGSNISSDKNAGIGAWTDDQFVAAVRDGVGRHGENLYPAMPYDSFVNMSRADVLAVKSYLMSLPPVATATPPNQLSFPFNQRWSLSAWKMLNLPRPLTTDPAHDAQWNRGRYLVEGPAHCETCHTPRNLTMGMSKSRAFGGGDLGAWEAYNISADPVAGIGSWSDQELIDYLHTGVAAGRAHAAGPMAEAIEHSLQYLTEADLQAMVVYLRSVPAQAGASNIDRSRQGKPDTDVIALRGADAAYVAAHPGAALYLQHCASCHGAFGDGKGTSEQAYPSLYHQSTVGAPNTTNLTSVILNGIDRTVGRQRVYMPALGRELSDAEVAELVNYVAGKFGAPSEITSSKRVSQLRGSALKPYPDLLQQQ